MFGSFGGPHLYSELLPASYITVVWLSQEKGGRSQNRGHPQQSPPYCGLARCRTQLLPFCTRRGAATGCKFHMGKVFGEVLRICHRGRGDEAGMRARVRGLLGVHRRTHSTCCKDRGEQPRTQTPQAVFHQQGMEGGGLGPGLFADPSPAEEEERQRERATFLLAPQSKAKQKSDTCNPPG